MAVLSRSPGRYFEGMMSIDSAKTAERHAERMIEEDRAKRHRLLERAMRLWSEAEADQHLRQLDAPPERLH